MLLEELTNTIRRVHACHRCIPPEVAAEIAEHCAGDLLTDREIEVLRKVAAGSSNKIIATELAVAETTVKSMKRGFLVG
ncbi:MAG TPA: LuxR C-terminal-related transcriptional regulator [Bryobacteraceae bacterium]|jgi:DNA-binding NarL/FixJ family response regulator|nr:LuxR C-terminal-related transcriptional regulator [Bryobacteraceae bacterium]